MGQHKRFPYSCVDPVGGGAGGPDPPPPGKLQKYRVPLQYWSGSPLNHKATSPTFNVGPSFVRQRNIIEMAFRWRAVDGPLIVVLVGSFLPSSNLKRIVVKVGPL